MKVKALNRFEHILDSTIGRTRHRGEIFDVDPERAKLLMANNLVVEIEDPAKEPERMEKMEELAKAIDEADKPKRGRKKKS